MDVSETIIYASKHSSTTEAKYLFSGWELIRENLFLMCMRCEKVAHKLFRGCLIFQEFYFSSRHNDFFAIILDFYCHFRSSVVLK